MVSPYDLASLLARLSGLAIFDIVFPFLFSVKHQILPESSLSSGPTVRKAQQVGTALAEPGTAGEVPSCYL